MSNSNTTALDDAPAWAQALNEQITENGARLRELEAQRSSTTQRNEEETSAKADLFALPENGSGHGDVSKADLLGLPGEE